MKCNLDCHFVFCDTNSTSCLETRFSFIPVLCWFWFLRTTFKAARGEAELRIWVTLPPSLSLSLSSLWVQPDPPYPYPKAPPTSHMDGHAASTLIKRPCFLVHRACYPTWWKPIFSSHIRALHWLLSLASSQCRTHQYKSKSRQNPELASPGFPLVLENLEIWEDFYQSGKSQRKWTHNQRFMPWGISMLPLELNAGALEHSTKLLSFLLHFRASPN